MWFWGGKVSLQASFVNNQPFHVYISGLVIMLILAVAGPASQLFSLICIPLIVVVCCFWGGQVAFFLELQYEATLLPSSLKDWVKVSCRLPLFCTFCVL